MTYGNISDGSPASRPIFAHRQSDVVRNGAASKEFGDRGISVTAIGPGPLDAPFFLPAAGEDAVAYHRTIAALSPFSKTGFTDIEDIVPCPPCSA